jgi:hypothetical protein
MNWTPRKEKKGGPVLLWEENYLTKNIRWQL